MARLARVVIPGIPHHITQRGNRRQQVFFSNVDYDAYLELMAEWCRKSGVIWGQVIWGHERIMINDNNGNMIQKSDGTNTWVWGYDYENRQTSYDAPGTTDDATYVYSASGNRIQKTVNSVTEK